MSFPEIRILYSHLTQTAIPGCQFIQRPTRHSQNRGEGQYPTYHVRPGWVHIPAVKGQRLVPNQRRYKRALRKQHEEMQWLSRHFSITASSNIKVQSLQWSA